MAVKLVANYSKRLGLPGYSSHQFSVTVESELHNTDNVSAEAERLYKTLQSAVDREMQSTGFVPGGEYGSTEQRPSQQADSHRPAVNGSPSKPWKASDKQSELVLKHSIVLTLFTSADVLRRPTPHCTRGSAGR